MLRSLPMLRGDRLHCPFIGTRWQEQHVEYRQLGHSGLKVPVLSFGTAGFGGKGAFEGFGTTGVEEATRLVSLCLEAGVTLFDSADVYSAGLAEELLGAAIRGRR